MLRLATILMMTPALATAGPVQRQPTPGSVAAPERPQGPVQADKAQDAEARQKALNAKVRRSMGGVCRGC